MKPQITLTEGSLTLEVYGGYGEIGGNCVVVKDKDRKIVFDNGIRFQVLKRYYRGRIRPLGVGELRNVGVIPPLNIFEDANAVYISHFHLDHLGLLGSLPPGTKVYVPSTSILEAIEDWYRRSPTWLAELPRKLHLEVIELEPYRRDEFGVTPILVSHSAHPAYAFLFEGYDKTLFYSGDLRIDSPLRFRIDTISNLEKMLESRKLDLALLEGTNVGDVETPISSEEFRSIMNRILLENVLVIVSIDPLDFELFTSITELASLNGRNVVIASPKLVDVVSRWFTATDVKSFDLQSVAIATELDKPFIMPVRYVSLSQEVFSEPESFLLIQEPESFLEMLRQMKLWGKELPKNSVTILTTPEPLEAESEIEEEILTTWLYSLGVQVYRIRFSGHYYPHDLRKILNVLKPRKLTPIHTKRPKLITTLAELILKP